MLLRNVGRYKNEKNWCNVDQTAKQQKVSESEYLFRAVLMSYSQSAFHVSEEDDCVVVDIAHKGCASTQLCRPSIAVMIIC